MYKYSVSVLMKYYSDLILVYGIIAISRHQKLSKLFFVAFLFPATKMSENSQSPAQTNETIIVSSTPTSLTSI